jgi:toxin-antitoxin system PIN domain toxin
VILVDANLLIYAVDKDAPLHRPARRWFESTLSGSTTVGLAWVVILAFLRITTRAGLLRRPLPPEVALGYVESWLQQPYVEAVSAGPRHWSMLKRLLEAAGTAGNLTSDAHLAAMGIERAAPVYSTDNDFKRFPGLDHINPLEP